MGVSIDAMLRDLAAQQGKLQQAADTAAFTQDANAATVRKNAAEMAAASRDVESAGIKAIRDMGQEMSSVEAHMHSRQALINVEDQFNRAQQRVTDITAWENKPVNNPIDFITAVFKGPMMRAEKRAALGQIETAAFMSERLGKIEHEAQVSAVLHADTSPQEAQAHYDAAKNQFVIAQQVTEAEAAATTAKLAAARTGVEGASTMLSAGFQVRSDARAGAAAERDVEQLAMAKRAEQRSIEEHALTTKMHEQALSRAVAESALVNDEVNGVNARTSLRDTLINGFNMESNQAEIFSRDKHKVELFYGLQGGAYSTERDVELMKTDPDYAPVKTIFMRRSRATVDMNSTISSALIAAGTDAVASRNGAFSVKRDVPWELMMIPGQKERIPISQLESLAQTGLKKEDRARGWIEGPNYMFPVLDPKTGKQSDLGTVMQKGYFENSLLRLGAPTMVNMMRNDPNLVELRTNPKLAKAVETLQTASKDKPLEMMDFVALADAQGLNPEEIHTIISQVLNALDLSVPWAQHGVIQPSWHAPRIEIPTLSPKTGLFYGGTSAMQPGTKTYEGANDINNLLISMRAQKFAERLSAQETSAAPPNPLMSP